MKLRNIGLPVLLLFGLACNAVTRGFNPLPPVGPDSSSTPAYVPPGCEAVVPATVPAATEMAGATPGGPGNPQISVDMQLKVFDKVVDVINRVYVYPDFNGIDWPAIVASHRATVQGGLDTEDFYAEMRALLEDLGDEHSYFESPADVAISDAELAGNNDFVGVGIFVLPQPDKGQAAVVEVFPGSPAEHAGIRPHDAILAVDGEPIVEDGLVEIQRVRGPECSAVLLTVRSPGGDPRDLLLIRHAIGGGTPVDARLVTTTDGSRVGYILLPTFFDETIPGKVAAALRDFGDLDGLILDNRLNGGGSSSVVEPILAFFTSGVVGSFKSRTESRPLTIAANPIHNSQSVPLVILVGEDTVSFGEIFSGALKDIGRAQIAGQTTLGNVETLHGYNFDDGSRIWVAEETFDPPVSHANWEQTGIVPDAEAHADWDTFTFETDPAIAAALKLLGH